jgi:hypothetical protein
LFHTHLDHTGDALLAEMMLRSQMAANSHAEGRKLLRNGPDHIGVIVRHPEKKAIYLK